MSKTETTKELAAARAGMNIKTARRYLADDRPPSERRTEHTWRTRKDPFEDVWSMTLGSGQSVPISADRPHLGRSTHRHRLALGLMSPLSSSGASS